MTMLKVSSPAELLSAVPFLVGFHPADSLIVVAMHGPRISFAARTDLPEHDTPEEEARAVVLHLATVVLQQQPEAVTIIGYGEESRATPAVLRISDAFRKTKLAIVDELRVTDGRFWSYLCNDVSCCPPEGQPCEPAYSVVATEATYAGAVALPSREALADQLNPVTGDEREAMTAATARAILRLAALASERPPAPDTPADETSGDPQRSAAKCEHHATGGQDGDSRCPSGTQLWMATDVTNVSQRWEPWSAGNHSAGSASAEASGSSGRSQSSDPAAREAGPQPVDLSEPSAPLDAAAESIPSDVRETHHFHDEKAPYLLAATSDASHSGAAELHLTNVIWASLGLAPPAPDKLPQSDSLLADKPEPDKPEPDKPEPDRLQSDKPEPDEPQADEQELDESGGAAKSSGLLSDEDYFFALVRAAGRTAVQEAERCYSAGGRLTDDDAAWLGVLLLNTPVRDYAWTRTGTHEWELALWSDLTRRVNPRYVPAPASLLAFVAWRIGLGPLASAAVARALDQKLDYSLANLMQGALIIGLPPSTLDGWPDVDGMPPIDDDLDSADPRPDQPAHVRPNAVTEPQASGFEQVPQQSARRDLAEPDGRSTAKSKSEDTAEPKDRRAAKPDGSDGSDRVEPADRDRDDQEGRDATVPGGRDETGSEEQNTTDQEVLDGTDADRTDPARQYSPHLMSRDGTEPELNRPGRFGQLPVRVRSDVAPADARNGAGDRPGRRDKRPQKTRRASARRL